MRWNLSESKHPLILSVDDSQSLLDGMDFNRIDHVHRHQRSHGVEPHSHLDRADLREDRKANSSLKEDTWNKGTYNVGAGNEIRQKDSHDTDYEYDDPWTLWKEMVKSRQITSPIDNDSVNTILEALMYKPIIAAGVGYRGTQLKATLILEGKQRVVFKPMR